MLNQGLTAKLFPDVLFTAQQASSSQCRQLSLRGSDNVQMDPLGFAFLAVLQHS